MHKTACQLSKKRHEDIWPDGVEEGGGRSHRGVLCPAATTRLLRYAKPAGRDALVLAARIPRARPGIPPALARSSFPTPGRDRGFIFFFLACRKGCVREWEEASRRAPGNALPEQGFAQHLSSSLGAVSRCKCRKQSKARQKMCRALQERLVE